MSLTARLLVFTSLLLVLTLPRGAAAEPETEAERLQASAPDTLRTWDQEQRYGLQASRLSVSIASLNVAWLSIWGSIWLNSAGSQSSQASSRAQYAVGSIQVAGAVANFVWLLYAGENLRDYKRRTGTWITLRGARLHTAVSSVDTALLLPWIVGGSVLLVRQGNSSDSWDRFAGLSFLLPSLAMLPFHIWALVVNGRELRYRKRNDEAPRARKIEPMPNGFRF